MLHVECKQKASALRRLFVNTVHLLLYWVVKFHVADHVLVEVLFLERTRQK